MNRQSGFGFFLLLSALMTASCSKIPPEQEHFAKGYSAYKRGDFTSAVLYLKPLVEAGNPAAQLLLAKMYANGNGVAEDVEKSEMLRNLAAFQIYKKKNLSPGEMNPLNNSLSDISKRLDYYVGAAEGKAAPVKDLSQILDSLDIRGIVDLQKSALDQEESSPDHPSAEARPPAMGVSIDLPAEMTKNPTRPSSESPESIRIAPAASGRVMPEPPEMPVTGSARTSAQISLSIIRQAAENGDPMAMGLLSSAYAHGFYGLTRSPAQAGTWAARAHAVRLRNIPQPQESRQDVPLVQMGLILGIGISLVGGGLWFWRRQASR